MMSTGTGSRKNHRAVCLEGVDPETCMIVFKTHWAQVVKILEKHDPFKNIQAKYGAIPPDEASTVQNYVEHMLFLLIEEHTKDAAMGPILEFVVTENIMEKLFLWSLRREFTDEMKIEQLKIYEMLVSQSHQPLLHHKPILKPLMMLLSSCSGTTTPAVEVELVVLLNQLCSILAKDPSILELFFHTSEDQGAANFLIFSLLIPFIHREGTVGQQARDALLFIMSLSAENSMVANHIVENTYFCPVLATGLSGLYSSLPTKLEDKGEEWHCLLKDDWLLSPALVKFMNSLEFCNAVIQVAHSLIRNQLVNYIYNGFLVPVMAPALHKVTVEEVMTTTAYLDLFLRSVSEPALLKIFLRFILLHRHENVHILDTLTSRINTPFRLCVVSLALFRTLISLHCEDVMLQLVLRYLISCNHIMLSQRWAVREKDWYSVSAARLLALTPVCCSSGITLTLERQEKDYILWRKNLHGAGAAEEPPSSSAADSTCIVEYGKAVDISYLQYLWDAQALILHCMKDCQVWSAPYDGKTPDPHTFIQPLIEDDGKNLDQPIFRLQHRPPSNCRSTQVTPLGEKMHLELEWDDSYDTGISPGSDAGSPQHGENVNIQPSTEPPKHIQEMKKNAIMLIKGSYIEESDFQDDVMVYRLCAQKDAQEVDGLKTQVLNVTVSKSQNAANQEQLPTNGPLKGPQPDADLEEDNMNLTQQATPEQMKDLELQVSSPEADHNSNMSLLSPESEDFISQCDNIIKELDSNSTGLVELKLLLPDPISPVEEEDDFENFSADTPSAESMPSPFGSKDPWSSNPARIQSVPFTGPFISVVLSKLENMLENSLHVNLLLIGIITHLASYPQPLLRSFLLNTNMVFQPSVRSLYQVLASVKNKIEQFASIEKDFSGLLIQAQQYLLLRVDMSDVPLESLTKVSDSVQNHNVMGKGKNLSETSQAILQPFLGSKAKKGATLPSVPLHIRNAILAAALFPEFLKELAALAQEHSILCYKVFGDFEDYYRDLF
ncbi:FHF complex subunit HOOK interacting protein 1A [Hemicordylus capensis]|uniref:FHF complex subunit HOOK interacting protein 1A n=1 Tax=Hemicordylus capensis TaxID=884348 RepID=UPI00230208F1|nr:FHF complex subunit HOOK interacting protein 1A [Hemicordylus capensis]XP_053107926.1 FHF complex subunit HOOK interacting protein 1A [Hemicordylus capensis]XP_053107927.1 FHF complex subunit HOOK interacting protein 1A [Hemicordylus capensis]XP_053107929.1 FHF complex subunit HOOK interacting protein 1A [Hemicordylus capensis]XP_053107930.1 FHF complex subunit HOOK interacting protein 1A [Hemicordylus capensis]XP_053107931.1 FHF complex subunit HOOK interacting protein 1A [Hemicordylus cap